MPIINGSKGKLISTGIPTPWYRLGGAPMPILAYNAVAASYALSKINLASPGTYDLIDTGHVPAWDGIGWTTKIVTGLTYFETGYTPTAGAYTFFMEYLTFPTGSFFGCYANNAYGVMSLRIAGGTSLSRRGAAAGSEIYWDPLTNPAGKVAASQTFCFCDGLPLTNLYGGNNTNIADNGLPLFVGAENKYDGVVGSAMKIAKCALYSGSLTPYQMAALTDPTGTQLLYTVTPGLMADNIETELRSE
jgi:hypothetical protein